MKKRNTLLLAFLLAGALLLTAAAAGGDSGDPLISLSYLQNTFAPKAEQSAQEKIDAAGKSVYSAAEAKWRAAVDAVEASLGGGGEAHWVETRLKRGDVISAGVGSQFVLLAGEATASCSAGAVVDVTGGTEFSSATALLPNHRCLVAEDTSALFSVTSRTAVVLYCGGALGVSDNAPDYNAMAAALRELNLFRGTGSGIGEGFELENTPTRIQALIMLIRLLGEENAALASAAPQPFADVPAWAERYVAYAVERGYTNGVSATRFAPDLPANAGMYVEFVLRAMGYSSTAQADVSTAAARALDAGVITAGEKLMLDANAFLRADVAYLSWYALEARLPDGVTTLREKLEGAGVFTEGAYQNASMLVRSARVA